ncbi:MAG: transglutaminase-like domain-containing protein, partial [Acidobacteriota bacterium]|nr:transglutaminase-like domain-containing protein [Acidobacteriota bacterium]
MQRLLEALREEHSAVPLDVAALEIASIEFPGLDNEAAAFRLDNLAGQIRSQLTPNADGLDFIRASNELLFDVLQFRGNEDDYYDPRNCCLNSVL